MAFLPFDVCPTLLAIIACLIKNIDLTCCPTLCAVFQAKELDKFQNGRVSGKTSLSRNLFLNEKLTPRLALLLFETEQMFRWKKYTKDKRLTKLCTCSYFFWLLQPVIKTAFKPIHPSIHSGLGFLSMLLFIALCNSINGFLINFPAQMLNFCNFCNFSDFFQFLNNQILIFLYKIDPN